jgi:hypothetical protein
MRREERVQASLNIGMTDEHTTRRETALVDVSRLELWDGREAIFLFVSHQIGLID